ncbi:hypothetical protein ABT168_06585 [Streptomyces sp. NPDC001793]|uniref:hypothetical protein n=1 Tax=Streptomyces sp. NPDC001793 TaxID=3154657 RepID=UPI0033199203
MPSCIHCGAPLGDPFAASCPQCGMPNDDGARDHAYQPHSPTRGYVRVGPTILPQWLLWLLAVLLVGGGITAYAVIHSADGASQSIDFGPSGGPPPTTTDAGPTPTPDSDLPTTPDTSPTPTSTPTPTPTPTPNSDTDTDSPNAIVEKFYDAINSRDFRTAWDLGGKNIGGDSYTDWVSGYDTTVHIDLSTEDSDGGDEVHTVVRALQKDGSVKVFEGTYTVSDGAIVNADMSAQ